MDLHLSSSPIRFPFLAPGTMRDFAGCLASQALRIAEATCSGNASSSMAECPIQNAVTCFYRTVLSTRKQLLTKVVWSRNQTGASLSVAVEDGNSSNALKATAANIHLLKKKKGSKPFAPGGSAVSLHWDVSTARYGSGPEPASDFYLVVVADSEFALLLGDMCGEFVNKFDGPLPIAESAMVSRREQVRGAAVYSTRTRLGDGAKEHEIVIRFRGDELDAEDAELCVSVDRKKMISVRRLRWNFRGNQTIFVDGSTVDVMWDVHDWWFCDSSHCALFMFRRRSAALESRVWFDEDLAQGVSGFSLLIQAFKSQ